MEYISALKFVRSEVPDWLPKVLRVSSSEKRGIDEAWESMTSFYNHLVDSRILDTRRGTQQKKWMWKIISQELIDSIRRDPSIKMQVPLYEKKVMSGDMTSGLAAEELLSMFLSKRQ
jgi:LAO/AO transport system kinase